MPFIVYILVLIAGWFIWGLLEASLSMTCKFSNYFLWILVSLTIAISVYLGLAAQRTFEKGTVVHEYKIHSIHDNSENEVQLYYDYQNHIHNVQEEFHSIVNPPSQVVIQRVRECAYGIYWMGLLDSTPELK